MKNLIGICLMLCLSNEISGMQQPKQPKEESFKSQRREKFRRKQAALLEKSQNLITKTLSAQNAPQTILTEGSSLEKCSSDSDSGYESDVSRNSNLSRKSRNSCPFEELSIADFCCGSEEDHDLCFCGSIGCWVFSITAITISGLYALTSLTSK